MFVERDSKAQYYFYFPDCAARNWVRLSFTTSKASERIFVNVLDLFIYSIQCSIPYISRIYIPHICWNSSLSHKFKSSLRILLCIVPATMGLYCVDVLWPAIPHYTCATMEQTVCYTPLTKWLALWELSQDGMNTGLPIPLSPSGLPYESWHRMGWIPVRDLLPLSPSGLP
jgi:hypothetical protein